MISRGKSASAQCSSTIAFFGAAVLLFGLVANPERPELHGLPGPPVAHRDGVVDVMHGNRIPDPYRWLEDQQSPQTRAWIEAENNYTDSILSNVPGKQALVKRLAALERVDVTRMPIERHGRYFYMKRLAQKDLFTIDVRDGLEGRERELVDPEPLSANHTTTVHLRDVSQDGTLVAYGIRQGGADELEIKLRNADSGEDLPDALPEARYEGVSITPDKRGIYYSRQEAAGPRVCYHAMGSNPATDRMIFGQGYGPDKIITVDLSDDGHYLLLTVLYGSVGEKTELYLQNLATGGPIRPIVTNIHAQFNASIGGDTLFIRTDWKAPRGRVLSAPVAHPERAHWKEIIPQSDSVIRSVGLAGGKVMVNYTKDATSSLKVFDPDGRAENQIAFPTLGTVSGVDGRWNSDNAFFEFNSFSVPPAIYHYSVKTAQRSRWTQMRVPIDSRDFELKQVWYHATDGTRVPMFLLYKKGLKPDGKKPTLMTAYGGFDISMTPAFDPEAVAWVEEGGLFALPNLRGGGEFGEEWHQAGMFQHKQNVFDDFYAAAEWLIRNGYTNPSKLAITGRSNGGLLMGAAMTQRPQLFRAVVCGFPLLDMLRYQEFYVARFWVSEYGSADNAAQFKYLYAYSPYQHVRKGGDYPAVLFVTGDSDTRVAPLHARKMCALMQWANASGRPILMHYDTSAGHSGGLPIPKQIDETAREMQFLLWQLGVTPR
ncbi:MAG TPA: prolyl oligopeptidase family serine peptidase [Terriglobia bacterium]|nr:prolyl oligopeptidase family serine peptidase [Terriglobia bacterium]